MVDKVTFERKTEEAEKAVNDIIAPLGEAYYVLITMRPEQDGLQIMEKGAAPIDPAVLYRKLAKHHEEIGTAGSSTVLS